MTFLGTFFWVAILVGGLALSLWYGASWRTLAKAMAEAGQRPAAAPAADRLPDPTGSPELSEALL